MNFKILYCLLISVTLHLVVYGQAETYIIKEAPFSSERYDEYCPVYYKNGIVFCSNRNLMQVAKYSSSKDKNFFKIFYIDTTGDVNWQSARLFSKNLKTRLNDGPVSFSKDKSVIYYSRNLLTEGKESEISGPRNKLGLFSSVFDGVEWLSPKDFRFNNEWYNITTPCLSPDGERLYFAADKPGGYGGSDLYYCPREKDYWGNPVNLGPEINTTGNEAYPFINDDGELYFSSDGHQGLGGKDIFFSRCIDSTWLEPVNLDAPVNSEFDDFGFVIDTLLENGYFTSNRGKTLDIFAFKTNIHQIFYCEPQQENQYCYKFIDDGSILVDPYKMQYEWDFGNLGKKTGGIIEQCFPGPGTYSAKQSLIDKQSGKILITKLNYNIEIKQIEQPYISCVTFASAGDPIHFDGLKSYFNGEKILSFSWDFGDGMRSSEATVDHSYNKQGIYTVKLGMTKKDDLTGIVSQSCVSREVKIADKSTKASNDNNANKLTAFYPAVESYENAVIDTVLSVKRDLTKNAVFQIQITTSKSKLGRDNNIFTGIRGNYYVKEMFLSDSGEYSYIVSEEDDFLKAYMIYKDVYSKGFTEAVIKTRLLTSPQEIELNNLVHIYDANTDMLFSMNNNRMLIEGYSFLDQIVGFLNKFPGVKLLIEVHSDNVGSQATILAQSRQRAQDIVNYLIKSGIDSERLKSNGYGSLRPISSNDTKDNRKINRRVEFVIID